MSAITPIPNKRPVSHKTGLMYFKFITMLLACVAALVYMGLKIVEYKNELGNQYELRAIQQLMNHGGANESSIIPNRGAILDRNRQTLAHSSLVYKVFADVRLLSDRYDEDMADPDNPRTRVKTTFENVSAILGIPIEDLWAMLEKDPDGTLKDGFDTNYKILTKEPITPETAALLNATKPYDIYTEEDSSRQYSFDGFASQTLGFIRGDSSWGLENSYNKELSGVPGRVLRRYDSNGRAVVSEREEAEEGWTLITTLDLYIQQEAERIAIKYGQEHNAVYTAVLVMDPKTGGVVAMAAYPSFNLNDPMNPSYITNPAIAEAWGTLEQTVLAEEFNSIWKNFNTTFTFEPGSIYKPITVASAIEEGIINPDDTYYCGGSLQIAGYNIRCINRSGHGQISVREAIAKSCNVAMMEMAAKMGREIFYKYQKDFGYGDLTGIDLPYEESAESLLHRVEDLNASELATASFGQRFKCTPIQALTGFNALVNGGILYKPYLVSQAINGDNNVVYERRPEITRKVISEETSSFMRDAMVDTLLYGTGARAYVAGHAIGGKSGTAEQGLSTDPNYHEAASFIGYFPADDPQYTVLTIIYNPEGDTPSASYMFMETVMEIIDYKRMQPTEAGAASGLSMSDYTDMPVWQAMQQLNGLGINYGLVGEGGSIVEGQFPAPGVNITDNSTVYLMIKRFSDDEQLAEVPDLYGLTAAQAREAINAAGFVPIVNYDSDNNYDEYNTVYLQMPEPFIQITPGSEVRIRVRTE